MITVGFPCPGCGHAIIIPTVFARHVTRVENRVLSYIAGRAVRGEPAPTFEEIAQALGRSSRGNVCKIIRSLEKKGLLTRPPMRRKRALALTTKARAMFVEEAGTHA